MRKRGIMCRPIRSDPAQTQDIKQESYKRQSHCSYIYTNPNLITTSFSIYTHVILHKTPPPSNTIYSLLSPFLASVAPYVAFLPEISCHVALNLRPVLASNPSSSSSSKS